MKFVHEYNDYPSAKNVDNGIWLFENNRCYNRRGGYHEYRPHPMDEFFEADSWRDIIKQSFLKDRDKYITGWIAPDGEFFGCAPEDHDDLAEYVLEKTQSELEETGWLKVYEVPWRLRAIATYREDYGPYSYFGHPTEKQEITLERLGIKI